MIITKELLKQIKPKERGKSDKFSWNFYKVLNKLKDKDIKIFYNTVCNYREISIEYDKQSLSITNTIISTMEFGNDLVGNYLSTVLREGKFEEFQLVNYKKKTNEITEQFFKDYIEIGRCLFDSSHNGWLRFDKDRFNEQDDVRTCKWCGKKQIKMSEVVTEVRDYWVDETL